MVFVVFVVRIAAAKPYFIMVKLMRTK